MCDRGEANLGGPVAHTGCPRADGAMRIRGRFSLLALPRVFILLFRKSPSADEWPKAILFDDTGWVGRIFEGTASLCFSN